MMLYNSSIIYYPKYDYIFTTDESNLEYIFKIAELEDNTVFYCTHRVIYNLNSICYFKKYKENYAGKLCNNSYIVNFNKDDDTKKIFHWEENDCVSMLYAEKENDIWIIKDEIMLSGWKYGQSFYECKIFDNEYENFDQYFRDNIENILDIYFKHTRIEKSPESKFSKYFMELKSTYDIFS